MSAIRHNGQIEIRPSGYHLSLRKMSIAIYTIHFTNIVSEITGSTQCVLVYVYSVYVDATVPNSRVSSCYHRDPPSMSRWIVGYIQSVFYELFSRRRKRTRATKKIVGHDKARDTPEFL